MGAERTTSAKRPHSCLVLRGTDEVVLSNIDEVVLSNIDEAALSDKTFNVLYLARTWQTTYIITRTD